MAGSCGKLSKVHLVQIVNKEEKDSLVILTTSRLHALAYYIFTKMSINVQMTPKEVKTIIDDFLQDPRNIDLTLSMKEVMEKLRKVDEDAQWQGVLDDVQILYKV